MPDLLPSKSVSITSLLSNLELAKYNPSSIQRTVLDYLDEVTGGVVDIVDPTNPFVFLLEASAVNTALAVNENMVNLRKQYASLSQIEEELYLHLSDKDYINRFSSPCNADFTILFQLNELLSKMVYDYDEMCHKATIARDTEFSVDNIKFTLQYPIDIRKYDNGVVQISYNTDIVSPLQSLSSNIIKYIVRKDNNGIDWISFKVPVTQFFANSTYFTLQRSIAFNQDIMLSDKFYYVRCYYRNNNTSNKWVEILTTHTDQVFDPFKPTAIIKSYLNRINVSIPIIYQSSGLLSGELRIDVFETKGEMTANFSNYKLNSFSMQLKALDPDRDSNDFTNAFAAASFSCYTDQIVSGGTNGIDFNTLRERVIFNSLGEQHIPITNVQIDSYVANKGFDLIKNVDVLTNRIFLAAQRLPKPLNTRLITSANIGISTYVGNIDYLRTLSTVKNNILRTTIMSNNVFLNENGIIKLITKDEVDGLKALGKVPMIDLINSKQYLYNPFYYVLDNSKNEFEVRIYNLDYPEASNLSFKSQNYTLRLPVSTGSYRLEKTSNGYKLYITTASISFYQDLEDSEVGMQIGFYPVGESYLAYINGTLDSKTANGERVYSFPIDTNYDINSDHQLAITNSKMFNNELLKVWVDLETQFHVFHVTNSISSTFKVDNNDRLVGKFILPRNSVLNTYEVLDIKLGDSLKNLWSRSRSLAAGLEYDTYTDDMPMMYDRVVYKVDPVTGSIFDIDSEGNVAYTILHQPGDPVLTDEGLPVYKNRKGDVITDNAGNAVIKNHMRIDKEIDILFVDGKYYFADDASFVNYKDEISGLLTNWITEDIKDIQTKLLEQTKIFFYPKTTLGKVKINIENQGEDYITSEQSFIVDIYVKPDIYINDGIKQLLVENTVKLLDEYIDDLVVNMSTITIALSKLYGDTVVSYAIRGLGGAKDYKVISINSEHNRLCLKKKLQIQQDNTLIIKEDVTVNFYRME